MVSVCSSEYSSIGAEASSSLSARKALSCSGPHRKAISFLVVVNVANLLEYLAR